MRCGVRAIEELRDKYVTMLAMRVEHERGEEREGEPRRRMAALAARFPGALREIDDLELEQIRERIEALEAVLRGEQPAAPWMEAVARFHALARGALCAKRWLRGRKRVDGRTEAAFAEAVEALAFAEDARAWAGELASVAAPPRGRVMDVVFARVARELGVTEGGARRLVFGVPRRERKKGSHPGS